MITHFEDKIVMTVALLNWQILNLESYVSLLILIVFEFVSYMVLSSVSKVCPSYGILLPYLLAC